MSKSYARYKLPKNIGKGQTVYLFPSYVSNGHWAIAKARLTNAPLFADETSVKAYLKGKPHIRTQIADDRIHQINTSIQAPKKYTATKFVQEVGKTEYRIFRCAETGDLAQFDRSYLALFELDQVDSVLWGTSDKTTFRNTEAAEDMSFLVMPVRMDFAHVTSIFGKAIETFTKETTTCQTES